MFTLWSSDILVPSSLVTLSNILQKIRSEINERHEYIGNWLFCLRDRATIQASRRDEQEVRLKKKPNPRKNDQPDSRTSKKRLRFNQEESSRGGRASEGGAQEYDSWGTERRRDAVHSKYAPSMVDTSWIRLWSADIEALALSEP